MEFRVTNKMRSIVLGIAVGLIPLPMSAAPVLADSLVPVNIIGVSFAPIGISPSFNYDFSTGELTVGTATASVVSVANLFQAISSDPTPPDPNGSGTFVGTARPEKIGGETAVYEQSACPSGYPTCLSDGSFTAGYFYMNHLRGATLDQLTMLSTDYYVQAGCFGGGSPRFGVVMSNGAEIHVYLGTYPNFTDCPPAAWLSTGNFATDTAGLRWDASSLACGTFYDTYSGTVTCANSLGLTIKTILVGTDGGWSGANPVTTQTFYFHNIQVNGVTRFPN